MLGAAYPSDIGSHPMSFFVEMKKIKQQQFIL